MNARFRITNPDGVDITLCLSAKTSEWAALKKALYDTNGQGAAFELGRKIGVLIDAANKTLAAEQWTTGYGSGEVDAGA